MEWYKARTALIAEALPAISRWMETLDGLDEASPRVMEGQRLEVHWMREEQNLRIVGNMD